MKKLIDIPVFLIATAFLTIALFITCRKDLVVTEELQTTKAPDFIIGEAKDKPKWKDEIIVEFFSGDDNAAIRSIGGTHKEKVLTKAMEKLGYKPFHVIKVPDVSAAVEALKRNPNVKSVSPNYIIYSEQTYPNDNYYVNNSMWGLKNIKVDQVWPTNKGSQKVHIGLIDEGIMYFHDDLCGQIWQNPYDAEDGIDNDGNGYVDDIHGWCFYHNHNKIWDNADQHGTHTAGTIGAKTNNTIGVAGVNPDVTIISAKFLQVNGTTDAAIKATDYLTGLKLLHPEMIIPASSNSWGYEGGAVQQLSDAIERAKQADILFVAAAGNNNADADVRTFYPASHTNDNIISVAAIDANDNKASFSNWGANNVDLGAPGVGIWSTVQGEQVSSAYASFSGTSMATPHVSGAVALYKAGHPSATYSQIKSAILNSARPISALAGKCVTGGTLDVSTFTQGSDDTPIDRICTPPFIDLTPPTAPTNVRQTGATDNSITIAWDAASDPESGIYFYGVQIKQSAACIAAASPKFNVPTISNNYYEAELGNEIIKISCELPELLTSTYNTFITIGGLPSGTDFTIIIYAINNAQMQSPGSSPITASTTGVKDIISPTKPGPVKIIDTTASSIHYDWGPSTDNVGIYFYEIAGGDTVKGWDHWTFGGGIAPYPGFDGTELNIGNLPSGRYWYFNTRAVDRAGNKSTWTDTVWCHTLPEGSPPPPSPPPPPPPGDSEKPVVTIITPPEGNLPKGNKPITISISATDNVGLVKTQILIDDVVVCDCTQFRWSTKGTWRGAHKIEGRAYDAAGNLGRKIITVTKQ